ncbi:BTAD domain-containing putative transcriptional regulator [Planomonospora corallina]|uniref:BTAD domain-containing putative transcriptional regulator n=1 Tax=Planomonospora corallina TaxID=1806052 RepID=A0ABV8I2G8_9ACTN
MAAPDGEGGLRFAVLGPVQAWRDGAELDLGTPLQRSIIAMLLLREGRAVTPAEMIDGVWGEDAPPRALGALRTYVSRLRAVLEPERSPRTPPGLLTSVGRGYALRLGGARLDLTRFESGTREAESARRAGDPRGAADRLRACLALCTGEPLAGAVGPYAEHQRGRLAEQRMTALETLMDLDLELGRHAEVVSELVALTGDHPLRERFRAQLMLAYYRCGRQADALAVFTDIRQALIDELGVDPGPDLAALHQRILSGDPALAAPAEPVRLRPAPPEPAPAAPAPEGGAFEPPELPRPAQLPAAVNDFTGRRQIIERLHAVLSPSDGAKDGTAGGAVPGQATGAAGGTAGGAVPGAAIGTVPGQATGAAIGAVPDTGRVPVAAISGIGGVGKTTLAVHVAHAMQDRFPDGQLYADLRGYGDEPTTPESALAAFLRALGLPPDVIPDGLAERSALFRSLLAERRILLLLDNARDAAQVAPLLPGAAGCAALVTSRHKLADLPGARLIDLDVMEPDEALALFSAVAGPERVDSERAAAMDVVAACGFLPLAVRIVAARLAARPTWTVASLVPRLADERRRLDEMRVGNLTVESTFALGYGQLTEAQARAFRLLSLPGGPDISVSAASAVLGLDPTEAEDLLESLVDASLLEAPAPGRYRFHDLLKLFARRIAERGSGAVPDAGEGARALRRLLCFHLASARSAHRLAYEGSTVADQLAVSGSGHDFSSADEAVTWLTVEAENLFASISQAAAGARDAASLLPAADLLLAMEPLLESGSHVREFDLRIREVLAAARRLEAPSCELRCRYLNGRLLFGANRLAEAEREFLAVLELAERGDRIVTGEALNALAVVVGRQRRHVEALSWFDAARKAFREIGASGGEALTLSYSARDHLFLNQPEEAIAAAEQGLAIFSEIGSAAGTARARYHLGIVLSRVGRLNEAVHHHAECLAFFRTGHQRVWEQRVCARLAETLIAAERFADAVRHAEQALTVSREIGHPYGEAQALWVLGRALSGLGEAGRSRSCLVRAHDLFSVLGAPEAGDLRALLDRDQAGDGTEPVV